jgi:antitoxin ParD1/3/4
MPTRNVNLTDELDRFVATNVESGRYENASEVVRAGLRALDEREQERQAKLAALRAALEEGERSGVAEGWSFEKVREKFNLPHPTRG